MNPQEKGDDLEEINRKIKLLEETERVTRYYRKHPNKKKEVNKKWNAKNRNEYQRKYIAKQKLLSTKEAIKQIK